MSVFFNNIKSVFTSPIKVLIIFILPIIFILMFIYGEGGNIPTRVIVVDKDNTEFTSKLISQIDIGAEIVSCDEDEILDTMISCEADYALVIEEGYTDALFAGEDVQIQEHFFIGKEKLYALRNSISTYISSAKHLHSIADSDEEFYEMMDDINSYDVEHRYEIIQKRSAVKTADALGFLVQFIIYSTIIVVASIILDNENNITPRILSSPLSITKYLAEHFASFIVLQVVIALVLMLTLSLGFGYSFYGHFTLILAMIILFSISATALSVMVLSICGNSKIFYWTMVMLTTPLVMLGGCYFEVSAMPEMVQNLSRFLPTTWIMKVVREVLIDSNVANVGNTVLIFIAFTVVFLSISRIGLRRLLRAK